jgi:glycerol-3-phosphate dehydrogenase
MLHCQLAERVTDVRDDGGSRERIAVIGGGINGAGIAWELARRDYEVVVFEKGVCGAQTSSATTKMIHGGLRYLEHLHFKLVRESLRERAWLLENAPDLVQPLEIILPVYDDGPRGMAKIRTGLVLYDRLAAGAGIRPHEKLDREEILRRVPLRAEGLIGGFCYWDAQVDDFALVRAVIAEAEGEGVRVREQTRVESIQEEGRKWRLRTADGDETLFDLVVNAAGPWMNELLGENELESRYVLTLLRGSHLILDHKIADSGMLLQSSKDRRVFFVLPWKETTLVGTTEVLHHGSPDDVEATDEEIDYLLTRFNSHLSEQISRGRVASTFAGVRPLVGRATNPSAIGREFRVVRNGNLIHVFGGKMTTFMALARKVAMRADNYFGEARRARPAQFGERSNEDRGARTST